MSFDRRGRAKHRFTDPPSATLAKYILRPFIKALRYGSLTIVTPSGQRIEQRGPEKGPKAVLFIHRWRSIRRLIVFGDVGFAEAYADGDWSSPDLPALLELVARNLIRIEPKVLGLFPIRFVNRLRHGAKANTVAGSRQNIAFHYDLGNAFYRCWLDQTMSYSSGLYNPSQSLEEAQEAKLARVVDLLRLKDGGQVLEIGCGWGNLASRLGQMGIQVTGVTLSAEQQAYATAQIADQGLEQSVRIQLKDYRNVEGFFDRIVSIEMLEAVGERYWPIYFRTLRDHLLDHGRAVLQVITIDESRFAHYRKSADFIQLHIFHGGMLPTKRVIFEQAKAADLRVASFENFGDSYARTLSDWRHRFFESWPAIESLGFSARFKRIWDYYLSYCEAGFRARTIDVGLYVLEPRSRAGDRSDRGLT